MNAASESAGSTERPLKSVYHSAVDLWLMILLMASPLILVGMTVVLMQQGRNQESLHCLLGGAVTLLLIGLFTVPCRYTILSDSLTIRCGILFSRVPLEQIKVVEKSGSWLSAPALSLRRVKISTASRFYLVSPADRDRFIEELSAACGLATTSTPPSRH